MLDNELKSRAIGGKMTNPSVSKMILWEIDVMNNKLQSLDRRPDIFNDWEDAVYEELSLKEGIERVTKHDSAQYLH
jgi:hypothetical protein